MTDKEKIRAEIERRMFDDYNTNDEDNDAIAQGVCAGILSFIDSLPDEESTILQWKWIDPKYEYPLCLTREMDEFGDWHYSLSSGKISETCQYISLAELERLPDEPVDADAAMKELDKKIELTKEHCSWEGVDVDKFMDEVRGIKPVYIEKTARVSPGMLSNFGNSVFVMDVELTQAEQEKVFGGVPGIFSGTIKILLPCE